MAKNQFKNHIKVILKNHKSIKLVIERNNDFYYICDGISILKLPDPMYFNFIMPLNFDLFIALNNGESVSYDADKYIGDRGTSSSITNLFENEKPEHDVEMTFAVLEEQIPNRKVRIAIVDDHIACFNDEYISAVKDYCNSFRGSGYTKPIKYEYGLVGCMIAPIHPKRISNRLKRIMDAKLID